MTQTRLPSTARTEIGGADAPRVVTTDAAASRLRVCIVTHVFSRTDGQGRVNLEVARHLAERGHTLIGVASEMDAQLREHPNVTWIPVPAARRIPTALLRYQDFAIRSARAVRRVRDRVDVVQLNGAISYAHGDVNACHFVHSSWLRSPYHVSSHSGGLYGAYQRTNTWLNAGWERRAYGSADAVVAVSDVVQRDLVADVGVPGARITVIPNGVDTDEFRPLNGEPNALRQAIPGASPPHLTLFVGDVRTNRKNLDVVLRALAQLDERFHLAVVGDHSGGPYPACAAELGLTSRVHFLGHRQDVPSLVRGADALAFTSHYDPWGLVVLEAMASGVPVIVSPAAGAAIVIDDGVTGFRLRTSHDVEGVAATLRRLADAPGWARSVGVAAREVAERHSWTNMADAYEQIYFRVADARRARLLGSAPRS